MRKKIFIIEHLEPRVWKWCLMEYENISKIVGKDNLWFTNIKRHNIQLTKLGKVFREPVRDLKIDRSRVCVLDPEAKEVLRYEDNDKMDYVVFGGILGDYPPKKRTKKELTNFLEGCIVRNLGKKQMATDNAVYVVKEILEGEKFEKMKFFNKAVIQINKVESCILPFKYVNVDGKPFMSEKVINYLKKKKGF